MEDKMEAVSISEAGSEASSQARPTETPEEKKARKEAEKKAKAEAKAKKEAEKAARAAQRGQKEKTITAPDPNDPHGSHYGDLEVVQSKEVTDTKWTRISEIDKSLEGQQVQVRARLAASRGKGKSCFLVLRQRTSTLQCTLFADEDSGGSVSKVMAKYAQQIPKESIVDLKGTIAVPADPVESCTQTDAELSISDLHVVSRAAALPFELSDAARSRVEIDAAAERGEVAATVDQDTRLNLRYLDLRTPANQAIFRIQSGVCQFFRSSLMEMGFQEIHTPKLIGGSSEGGSEVFQFQYFGQSACLAQSPQLYKQMAICADFERVFEIGPVFRAENSFTHRHMCEFTGMDFEMEIKEHYIEVMDTIEKMFQAVFDGLESVYRHELETVRLQFPAEPFVMKPMRFTYAQGIEMLKAGGVKNDDGSELSPLDDIDTPKEKALGKIVKKEHGTDFYILTEFPLSVRPFYTMPCPHNPELSNSFDVFMRGEEIISGAQRIHIPDLLEKRAEACGIPLSTLESYINSFRLGAPPHGGCGVGMERVVMLYLGLSNIRQTSMFPRDPKRLAP